MRRKKGTGCIRQRSDGTWEGRFNVGCSRITLKPIQKSVYAKTREEVEGKLADSISAVARWKGKPIKPLREYCSQFLGSTDTFSLIEKWRREYYEYEFDIPEVDAFVYFISNGKYVKIGSATWPEIRLKDLQCGTPDKLEILFTIPVGPNSIDPVATRFAVTLEHQLHSIFEEYRIRNEWFDIPQHIIDEGLAYYGKRVNPGRKTFKELEQLGICKQNVLYTIAQEKRPRRQPMTYATNRYPESCPMQTLRECCRRTGLKQKTLRDAVNAGKVEYDIAYGKVTYIAYESLLRAIERGDIA